MNKKILVCGATGTIGLQALEVIKKLNYSLVGFSFNKNLNIAKKIKKNFPKSHIYSPSILDLNTVKNFSELIEKTKPNILLNAIVGTAGLEITILGIKYNLKIALANKESFVLAGWLINDLIKTSKTKIFPIDSEHSSIYDIFLNTNKKIEEIFITASGGPFFLKKKNELRKISFNDAIKHPNWKMGYKISIDSATMINKYFEIIEAYYIFKTKNIKVIQHSKSIIHSVVRFNDNSYFFSGSVPDMKLAILLALTEYKKACSNFNLIKPLNFNNLNLNFKRINKNLFLPIKWGQDFLNDPKKNNPIIINSANEQLIELFKFNKIKFLDIIKYIQLCLESFKDFSVNDLNDIYLLNTKIKDFIKKAI